MKKNDRKFGNSQIRPVTALGFRRRSYGGLGKPQLLSMASLRALRDEGMANFPMIKFSRQSATEYQVLRYGSHNIGTVAKMGFRWLAISPAHRSLGSFASMSEAGNSLLREDNKKNER